MSVTGFRIYDDISKYIKGNWHIAIPVYHAVSKKVVIEAHTRSALLLRATRENLSVVPIAGWMHVVNRGKFTGDYTTVCRLHRNAGFKASNHLSIRVLKDESSYATQRVLLHKDRNIGMHGPKFLNGYTWVGKPNGAWDYFYKKTEDTPDIDDLTVADLTQGMYISRLVCSLFPELAHLPLNDASTEESESTPSVTVEDTRNYGMYDKLLGYDANVLQCLDGEFCKYGPESESYLGVELEVATDTSSKNIHDIRRALDEKVICVNDSSIPRSGYEGVEIVTLPGTLLWHKRMLWKDFDKKLKPLLTEVPSDTKNLGVHVHVNVLTPLTGVVNITTTMKSKLNLLLNSEESQPFISIIAGRRTDQWNKTVDKEDMYYDLTKTQLEKYRQVNLALRDTVEFRMFNSTTDYDTLMSYLEFAHSAVEYVRQAGFSRLSMEDWCKWILEKGSRYFYLKKRFLDRIVRQSKLPLKVSQPQVRTPVSEWTFKKAVVESDDDLMKYLLMWGYDYNEKKIKEAVLNWIRRNETLPSGKPYTSLPEVVKTWVHNQDTPWMNKPMFTGIRRAISRIGPRSVPGVGHLANIIYQIRG